MKGFTNYKLCITDTASDTEATFQPMDIGKALVKPLIYRKKGWQFGADIYCQEIHSVDIDEGILIRLLYGSSEFV